VFQPEPTSASFIDVSKESIFRHSIEMGLRRYYHSDRSVGYVKDARGRLRDVPLHGKGLDVGQELRPHEEPGVGCERTCGKPNGAVDSCLIHGGIPSYLQPRVSMGWTEAQWFGVSVGRLCRLVNRDIGSRARQSQACLLGDCRISCEPRGVMTCAVIVGSAVRSGRAGNSICGSLFEDDIATITWASMSVTLPAHFTPVGAINLWPCGQGAPGRRYSCLMLKLERFITLWPSPPAPLMWPTGLDLLCARHGSSVKPS
jgi:hypothetical protein